MTPDKLAAYRVAVGGTRFLLTLGAGIVDTFLLSMDLLSESHYVTLTLATVGVYIGSNTWENVRTKANATEESKNVNTRTP